jgi:hypothetical protein
LHLLLVIFLCMCGVPCLQHWLFIPLCRKFLLLLCPEKVVQNRCRGESATCWFFIPKQASFPWRFCRQDLAILVLLSQKWQAWSLDIWDNNFAIV